MGVVWTVLPTMRKLLQSPGAESFGGVIGAAALLSVAAGLATLVPSLRAARIQPNQLLRTP